MSRTTTCRTRIVHATRHAHTEQRYGERKQPPERSRPDLAEKDRFRGLTSSVSTSHRIPYTVPSFERTRFGCRLKSMRYSRFC